MFSLVLKCLDDFSACLLCYRGVGSGYVFGINSLVLHLAQNINLSMSKWTLSHMLTHICPFTNKPTSENRKFQRHLWNNATEFKIALIHHTWSTLIINF